MVSQPGSLHIPRADVAGGQDPQSQAETPKKVNEPGGRELAEKPSGRRRRARQGQPATERAEFRRQRRIGRAEN